MIGRRRPPVIVTTSCSLRGWPGERTLASLPLPAAPFDLGPRQLVCEVLVDDEVAAQVALLAAARNVALVVRMTALEPLRSEFLDQLGRIADVRPASATSDALTSEQLELLDLLANGRSVAQAAAALNVSRRTAHRRLEAARRALGVGSVVEAIVAVGCSPDARIDPNPRTEAIRFRAVAHG